MTNSAKWLLLALGGAVVLFIILRARSTSESDEMETPAESEKIDQLIPAAAAALRQLRADLLAQGIRTLVGQTLRTEAEESAAVAAGKSATHKSWHLIGRAVDLYPYGADGQPDLQGKDVGLFRTMQDAASAVGFTNIAFNADGSQRFIHTSKGLVWDGGHMQYTDGMTFDEAAAQYDGNA